MAGHPAQDHSDRQISQKHCQPREGPEQSGPFPFGINRFHHRYREKPKAAIFSPRWTRRKDARPAEILDSALELFVKQGFAKTRIEDIAQRAGVTGGAIYRYFPNKDALLEALIRDSLLADLDAISEKLRQREGKVSDMIADSLWSWWQAFGGEKLSGFAS